MKPLPFNEVNDFEPAIISVNNGKEIVGVYTDLPIERETLPAGCYAYDIREGGNDAFSTVEPIVRCNHTGTIVTREEIPMLVKVEHDEYSDIVYFGKELDPLEDNDWRSQYIK